MALKGDRQTVGPMMDISFFTSDTVLERGIFLTLNTAGSGVANDQSAANVTAAFTSPSGRYVIGLLLNDVVNVDQTRQHINWHKDEVQTGGKVTLAKGGTWTTNMTSGTMTNCAGQKARLAPYGRVTLSLQGDANTPVVGQFLSNPDEDGYVKIAVNLP